MQRITQGRALGGEIEEIWVQCLAPRSLAVGPNESFSCRASAFPSVRWDGLSHFWLGFAKSTGYLLCAQPSGPHSQEGEMDESHSEFWAGAVGRLLGGGVVCTDPLRMRLFLACLLLTKPDQRPHGADVCLEVKQLLCITGADM